MGTTLARFSTSDVSESLERFRRIAGEVRLAVHVVPALATGDPLESQLAGVYYLLVEGAGLPEAVLAPAADLRLVQKHGEDCRNLDIADAARRGLPVATLAWAQKAMQRGGPRRPS